MTRHEGDQPGVFDLLVIKAERKCLRLKKKEKLSALPVIRGHAKPRFFSV